MQNNVDDELNRLQNWSLSDQWRLLEGLLAMIRQKGNQEPLHDVREFRGIGHGTWDAVGGVDEFIKQERASWDG